MFTRTQLSHGDIQPLPHLLKSLKEEVRDSAPNPAAALKVVASNNLPSQDTKPRHSIITFREEGKKGGAEITFIGSINNISLCQFNKKSGLKKKSSCLGLGELPVLTAAHLFVWATEVVNDKHEIDVISLQQVCKKALVSLEI